MTTCPRCGRIADDEVVCADCGMSLALARRTAQAAAAAAETAAAETTAAETTAAETTAAETTAVTAPDAPDLLDELGSDEPDAADDTEGSARDVRMWRLAALVCVTCLLAAATAIVLLHQRGPARKDAGLPFTPSSDAGAPSGSSAPATSALHSATATRHSGTPTPTRSASPSASKTKPTATQVGLRSSSASHSSAAPPPAPAPSVRLTQGGLDASCGPHCYRLVVTLARFGSGTHTVTCWSGHEGQFASYSTSSTTSSGCAYRRPHDSVWVVVAGRRSNTILW